MQGAAEEEELPGERKEAAARVQGEARMRQSWQVRQLLRTASWKLR